MRLLVVTQALDLDDPVLSAYHEWVAALAMETRSIEVICLKEGRHTLPRNVRVHTLGKERGDAPSFIYALRLLALVWTLRSCYDVVFVHMNQEHLLAAGWLWKLLRKPAYLWRNHYAGSVLTDLAAAFATNVFCTSRRSYTAKYRKTVFMPVGVNVTRFNAGERIEQVPRSILFFSRMTPSKRPELLIDALGMLAARGVQFTATFCGSPNTGNETYLGVLGAKVRERGIEDRIVFRPGVPNSEAPALYEAHEVFANCSPSGMLDKMLFEAAASGCLVLSESEDMRAFGFEDLTYAPNDSASLAVKLEELIALPEQDKVRVRARLVALAEEHSLSRLAACLVAHMQR